MVDGWRGRSRADLLAAYGLAGRDERALATDGWSGATFSTLTDEAGSRFVLKRTSLHRDWIARATGDVELREGWLAAQAHSVASSLPRGTLPYLGAAADADGVAILMPDLSADLIAWDRPGEEALDDADLERVVHAIATIHVARWDRVVDPSGAPGPGVGPPWTPLSDRLRLLSPRSAARYDSDGNAVGARFLAGWAAFDRRASAAATELVARLDADVDPLLAALERLPAVGLHGDLKLANVALMAGGAVGLIDWQLMVRAPVAVELGWFLVSNSGALPDAPANVAERYVRALMSLSGGEDVLGDPEAQVDLAAIVGLLLRGWRKGLDSEVGVRLASGMTAADDLAWWCAQAVAAADRRL